MLSSFSFITFRCLSRKSSVSFGALPEIKGGDSDAGDKVFRALRTSRWISVSKGELLEIDCVRGTFEEGTLEDTAEVFDEDTGVFKGVVGDSCGHRGTEGESSDFGE